jgi:hypothetical protein
MRLYIKAAAMQAVAGAMFKERQDRCSGIGGRDSSTVSIETLGLSIEVGAMHMLYLFRLCVGFLIFVTYFCLQ